MRRVLKKVAAGEFNKQSLGDTSALADPSVVETMIEGAKELPGK